MATSSFIERADQDEIFSHLSDLLGPEAVQIAEQVESLILTNQNRAALIMLREYDTTLGGIGIYTIVDKKPPGIYRSLFYVDLSLRSSDAENLTRYTVHAACAYLEELLKKIVHTWPWEHIRVDGLPLGALVNRINKKLPAPLAQNLAWLSKNVYNFAKHHFNMETEDVEEEPENYFSISEAVAVYLIVRKLGLELEALSGKSTEYFSRMRY